MTKKLPKIILALTCLLVQFTSIGQNLVSNPGFEGTLNGWYCISNAGTSNVFSTDYGIKHSGVSSVKMWNKNPNDTSFIAQIIPVIEGHHYVCDFWVKADSIKYYLLPFVKFRKDSIDIFNSYFCPNGNVSDWTKVSSRFVVPDSANNIVLFYHLAGKGIFRMDDVYLAELTDTSYTNFTVDISSSSGQFKELFSANGIGPGNSASPFNHVAKFQELGIDYIRTHDFQYAFDHSVIFPDTSRDPLDPSAYNFHTTDSCISDILSAGGKVYYRFGQSFDLSHTHNKPPYNYEKWAQVCLQTIKHYNDGWNNGFNYNLDYFEIWNEPDIKDFWTGTPTDYVKLYRITAKMIKQYDQTLKIGGPAISNVFNEDFTNTFLDSVKVGNIPLDFFSYHLYYHFNPWYFKYVNEYAKKKLTDAGLTNVELINSEWNSYLYSFDTPSFFGMDDALNAASLTGAMCYMQSSSIGKFFRYAFDNYLFGMVNWDDEWRYSGLAMRSVKQLMDNNTKINAIGGDSLGTVIFASKSTTNNDLNILIADNSSSAKGYILNLPNLTHNYWCNIYRIDHDNKYELIKSEIYWASSGQLVQKADPPFTDFIKFEQLMGIENRSQANNLFLFPNPAKDFINIFCNQDGEYNYTVINNLGSVILQGKSTSKNKNFQINIEGLQKNNYVVKISNGFHNNSCIKFIKN
jgi:hypothetical protein